MNNGVMVATPPASRSKQSELDATGLLSCGQAQQACYPDALGLKREYGMATSQSTMGFLLDQLSGLAGLSTQKMDGEYCVYLFGKPIGFVCDDQLHLKMTDAGHG